MNAAVALAALLAASPAPPEPGGVEVPPGAGAGAVEAKETSPQAPFRSASWGVGGDARYSSTRLKEGAMLAAGVRAFGVEARGGDRWLVRWDASAMARGGLELVAPAAWLYGVRLIGDGEAGYRFLPGAWSPYASLGAHVRADAYRVELVRDDLLTVMRGFSALELTPRASAGVSWLRGDWSVVAVGFARVGKVWVTHLPDSSATTWGLSATLDVARRWTAYAELSRATQPDSHVPELGLTTSSEERVGILGGRHLFRGGSWLGLELAFTRRYDQVRYSDPPLSVDTSNPGTFVVSLSYGYGLGG